MRKWLNSWRCTGCGKFALAPNVHLYPVGGKKQRYHGIKCLPSYIRHQMIRAGTINVPTHTSRNGTQSVDNNDLLCSPQVRKTLEYMSQARRAR